MEENFPLEFVLSSAMKIFGQNARIYIRGALWTECMFVFACRWCILIVIIYVYVFIYI